MTEDIAAKIRDGLAEGEHEDWCQVNAHALCCPSKECECYLGPRTRALRAVLDYCDLMARESLSSAAFAAAIRERIAANLGVSVSPLRGPNNPHPVSGSQPRSGDPTSGVLSDERDQVWLAAEVRAERTADAADRGGDA